MGVFTAGNPVLLAVGPDLKADPGGATGNDGLNVGDVNRGFLLQTATLGIGPAAAHVSINAVNSLNNEAVGLRQNLQDPTLLAAIIPRDDPNSVTFFNVGGHEPKRPPKLKR